MKQTSILAHESIKPSKEFLHSKILAGLKKIKKGLSAGRVQSLVVKIICDREKEIDDFI